jgi:hypothetical protein
MVGSVSEGSFGVVSVGRGSEALDCGAFSAFAFARLRQPLLEPFLHRCDDRAVYVNEKQRVEYGHQPAERP